MKIQCDAVSSNLLFGSLIVWHRHPIRMRDVASSRTHFFSFQIFFCLFVVPTTTTKKHNCLECWELCSTLQGKNEKIMSPSVIRNSHSMEENFGMNARRDEMGTQTSRQKKSRSRCTWMRCKHVKGPNRTNDCWVILLMLTWKKNPFTSVSVATTRLWTEARHRHHSIIIKPLFTRFRFCCSAKYYYCSNYYCHFRILSAIAVHCTLHAAVALPLVQMDDIPFHLDLLFRLFLARLNIINIIIFIINRTWNWKPLAILQFYGGGIQLNHIAGILWSAIPP